MDDEENRSDGDWGTAPVAAVAAGGGGAHGVASTVGRRLTAAVRLTKADFLPCDICGIVYFSWFYKKTAIFTKLHPSPQNYEMFPFPLTKSFLSITAIRIFQNEECRVARNLCLPVPGWWLAQQ